MQKQYITAELNIVRFTAQDIIVTSATMAEGSRGVADFGSSWNSINDGTIIGAGED